MLDGTLYKKRNSLCYTFVSHILAVQKMWCYFSLGHLCQTVICSKVSNKINICCKMLNNSEVVEYFLLTFSPHPKPYIH